MIAIGLFVCQRSRLLSCSFARARESCWQRALAVARMMSIHMIAMSNMKPHTQTQVYRLWQTPEYILWLGTVIFDAILGHRKLRFFHYCWRWTIEKKSRSSAVTHYFMKHWLSLHSRSIAFDFYITLHVLLIFSSFQQANYLLSLFVSEFSTSTIGPF